MLYRFCSYLLGCRTLRGRPVASCQDAWMAVDYGDWFGLVAFETGGSFTVDYRYATVELTLPLPGRKLTVSLTRCYGAEAASGSSGFELRFT